MSFGACEALKRRAENFLLLVVDCVKNLGEAGPEELLLDTGGRERLMIYRLPCAGENTGQREDISWHVDVFGMNPMV